MAVLALSLVPYEQLKGHLDPLTVDRNADVSRTEFDAIVLRLRVLAAGFGALGLCLIVLGRTIDRVVTAVAHSWATSVRHAPGALGRWLADEPPASLAALGAVVMVAVAVRVAFLDVPLRYDEATTYNNFVSKPLYVALANYATPNNHLLHTLLAKVSVTALGGSEWAIRLPALVAGLALVPATFALGRILYGRSTALLAAALVASSSTLVEYSTNARGYTTVALCTVVAFLAASRIVEGESPGAWGVLVVAGALGLYAVPIMVYPLGGVLVWIVVSALAAGRPLHTLLRPLGGAVLAVAILTLVLYAPVYAASGIRSVTSNEFVEPRSLGTVLDLLPEHAWDTLRTWTRDLPIVASIVLAAGLVGGLALTPIVSRFPVPPLLAVLAWTMPVLLAQRVIPFTRVWLFAVPIAAITAAGFFAWLLERVSWRRVLVPATAALLSVGAAWAVLEAGSVRASRETGALLDAPAVASFLAREVEPGDRIFARGSDTILEYYLGRRGVDARSHLYTSDPRARTFLVVNVLGGQVLEHDFPELDRTLGPPRLLKSYPSALVYLAEPRT